MASARVSEGAVLIIVNRQMFEEKVKKADPFVRGLLHVFSETVRRMSDE